LKIEKVLTTFSIFEKIFQKIEDLMYASDPSNPFNYMIKFN